MQTSQGPTASVGEGSYTACMECLAGDTWPMARAVALLCVDHGAVNQGQSRGSAGTLSQGKGRECWKVRIGKMRALGGERPMGTPACGEKGFKERTRGSRKRPMGAANFRQQSTQASCQTLPSLPPRPVEEAKRLEWGLGGALEVNIQHPKRTQCRVSQELSPSPAPVSISVCCDRNGPQSQRCCVAKIVT